MAGIDSINIDRDTAGIIFDYGGTLDSRGDHWSHIILDGYREAGCQVEIDAFIAAYIHAERELAAKPIITPADTFRTLMRKKIAIETDYLLAHGFITETDRGKSDHIADYWSDYARRCTAESAVTLRKLARNYPLALVTNFYGNINTVLTDFGIADCFTTVIESATAGVRKPDPAIFRLALEALKLPAGKVLVIGDSISKDIVPAQSLGCKTLLIEGRPWPPSGQEATCSPH